MSGKRRIFVGLALGEELGRALCELTGSVLSGGLRTYPPRDVHLTLHFIGSVEAERYPSIERALEAGVAGLPAPALRIESTGCFPERGSPRIWWAGVREPGDAARLEACHLAVLRALALAGEPPEAWTPHVTLARTPRRGGRGLRERRSAFLALAPNLDWRPLEVALFESRPDRPEARYRRLWGWPFSEPA